MSASDLTSLLTAPAGQLSLSCEQRGCFHEEGFDLHLSWAPAGVTFRSSATDELPDHEQFTALLRRVVAAASLPETAPSATSTTYRVCTLTWAATAADHTELRGELRWSTNGLPPDEIRSFLALMDPEKWPPQLDLAPGPVHALCAIARAPLEPPAPPRRYVNAVLEIDARDERAAGKELVGLLRDEELPSLSRPLVVRTGAPGGHTRLKMFVDVGKLVTARASTSLEEEPALRALERRIADVLSGFAAVRSVRYREVPGS